ncbi:serine hydrolase [Streptomyces sp. GESEQ-35]|uniref:serine hydrolase domain-containing protein n=1 Tax=Streptomyces sp. GESEQ-35 TaxID=2812657 RepID=UPI001B333DF6|nr:serine hydrolase domain-containing protein [Streptomyces sp. GESEQ-35]
MSALYDTLRRHVDDRSVPGAVGLVARGDDVEVVAVGSLGGEGTAPMTRDAIFRIASLSKPITAAAVLMLVEDGRIGLDSPVEEWLPELSKPVVVRTPSSPVDDVVPVARPITVEDLLSSRTGWGYASDFSLPAVQALSEVQKDSREPHTYPEPDVWLRQLAQVPLLHQPGESWLYHTSSDLQGVLIARASGGTLPDFLAERIFEPLGMRDTAFEVPEPKRDRFTTYFRTGPTGALEPRDIPDGDWSRLPFFPSGGGGLVSTADDLLAFVRLLRSSGEANGHRLLSATSVSRMTSNHLTARQRELGMLFLQDQGWGYGGQVDVTPSDPWNVPGRYGWVGGTGTTAYLVPPTGTITVLLTQVGVESPAPVRLLQEFWRCTAHH